MADLTLCLFVTVAQLITSLRGSSSLLPSEGWKNQTWNSSNVESPQSMRFGYKIECDANFFGDSCTKICIPRNDDLGHYECGPNGETICRQGWEGPFCTERKCATTLQQCLREPRQLITTAAKDVCSLAGGGFIYYIHHPLPWLNKLAVYDDMLSDG